MKLDQPFDVEAFFRRQDKYIAKLVKGKRRIEERICSSEVGLRVRVCPGDALPYSFKYDKRWGLRVFNHRSFRHGKRMRSVSIEQCDPMTLRRIAGLLNAIADAALKWRIDATDKLFKRCDKTLEDRS